MSRRPATGPEVVEAARLRKLGYGRPKIARAVRRSDATVQMWLAKIDAGTWPTMEHRAEARAAAERTAGPTMDDHVRAFAEVARGPEVVHLADEDEPEPTPDEQWRNAETVTERNIERARLLGMFRADLTEGDKPVAISFASDQHIDPSGLSAMTRMRQDAELIAATDGLYCCLVGDGVDNHIKHRGAVLAAKSGPDQQYRLFDYYLEILADSLICAISGNHDQWTKSIGGIDMVGRLVAARKLHYAPDCAHLEVTLGSQKYAIEMAHQYRFNSSLNLLHTVKRMWDLGARNFDIGVVAHHHTPAFEEFERRGKPTLGFRPGAYQHTSSHARMYGYGAVDVPTCPTVILFPGSRQMMPFRDVWQAVPVLCALRGSELPEPATEWLDRALGRAV